MFRGGGGGGAEHCLGRRVAAITRSSALCSSWPKPGPAELLIEENRPQPLSLIWLLQAADVAFTLEIRRTDRVRNQFPALDLVPAKCLDARRACSEIRIVEKSHTTWYSVLPRRAIVLRV